MKKFWKNNHGTVAPLVALMLPVILIFGAFTIEAGNTYVRISQLNHLAHQSANSGLLAFADIITTEAEKNHQAQCNGEIIPTICSSNNPFDFLDYNEIQSLALQPNTQITVQNNVNKFATDNDPTSKITSDQIKIRLPDDISPQKIFLRVQITESITMILPQFLQLGDDEISIEALASLPIR
jgi:hypothetical protein